MPSTEALFQSISDTVHQNAALIREATVEIDACVSLLNALSTEMPQLDFTLPQCLVVQATSPADGGNDEQQYRTTTFLLANPSREALVELGYAKVREAFPSFCQVAPFVSNQHCLQTLATIHLLFGEQLHQDVPLRKTWRLLSATLRTAIDAGCEFAVEMEQILATLSVS